MMGFVGLNVPKIDPHESLPLYIALSSAIKRGVVSSCHTVSRGGLSVHASLVAMSAELGVDIHLASVPTDRKLKHAQLLYSESCGRFIVTVAPENKQKFEEEFEGMKIGFVGLVNDSSLLRFFDTEERVIISHDIYELKRAWKKPFGSLV
jgi:phosphoribosylformylglycinamidine synthase